RSTSPSRSGRRASSSLRHFKGEWGPRTTCRRWTCRTRRSMRWWPISCTTRTAPIDDLEQMTVRRAQAGDAEAYGDLVGRHRSAALRVAAVVLGGADGADDVVQQ